MRVFITVFRNLRMRKTLRLFSTESKKDYEVIIAGGGLMGLSSAYFLAKRINPTSICVVERDLKYSQNSTVRSWGSIRQQFSIAENIQMSQFGFKFLQDLDKYLGIEGEDSVDVHVKQGTYCFLASEAGRSVLEENADIQRSEDVAISLLSTKQLHEKYPWLNTEGVALASNVSSGEGWFDPWLLLCHFKNKISKMGVHLIEGEVHDINTNNGRISDIQLTRTNSSSVETLLCGHLVNAAGAWAQPLAAKLGIDLPVRAAKRVTYVVDCPDGFIDPVLLFDTAQNIYLRPESSKQYIVAEHPEEVCALWSIDIWPGYSPVPYHPILFPEREDHSHHDRDFEVDYDYFDTNIWPKLAYRIPAFERLKVTSAWAGFYDYNIFDQNGIISCHPEIANFYLCNGFSGHGLQQSPAVGRAISELVIDGGFQTIDLSRFSFERFHNNKLIIENNII